MLTSSICADEDSFASRDGSWTFALELISGLEPFMFDAHQKWLGIPPKDQPPNYYRLLSVELFESDLDVIEGGADRVMAYIRRYQSGEYASEAALLLNEIATARLCLLKSDKKAAYDAKLKRELAGRATERVHDPFDEVDLPAPTRRVRSLPRKQNRRSISTLSRGPVLFVVITAVAVCVVAGLWLSRPRQETAKSPAIDAPPERDLSKDRSVPAPQDVSTAATSTSPPVTANTAPIVQQTGLVRSWKGKLGHAQLGTFSQDGQRLVYIAQRDVIVADTVSGETIATLKGNTKAIWTARFCEGDTHVVSVGQDDKLRIWNLGTQELEAGLPASTSEHGTVVAASPSALTIAFASQKDRELSVIDRQTGKILRSISLTTKDATFRAVTRDLRRALSNGTDFDTQVWDLTTGTSITIVNDHHNYCGDFSFDGTRLIIGGEHGWGIWDIASKSLVQRNKGAGEHVYAVAADPKMTRLMTGHPDGTIWVWDLASGKKVLPCLGHDHQLRTIKISPDNRYAVSQDHESTICQWRLPDESKLATEAVIFSDR